MRKSRVLCMIISALLLLATYAFGEKGGVPPDPLARFQEALNQDGIDVRKGTADILNFTAEYCTGKTENAIYSNTAPYLRFLVPNSAQDPKTLTDAFKLSPDEAIVLIGPTPPSTKYFGYYPGLITRIFPNGKRQQLFATLGDALNNATIKTVGTTPFNSTVALIFTPDRGIDARVRAALRKAGYPAELINTVVFPASMLKLGHGDAADELKIVLRIGRSDDPDAITSYIENAKDTIKVFRVTPRTQQVASPFPAPPLRPRGTGHTEMDLMNKVGQLRDGIIAANPGLDYSDEGQLLSKPYFYEGYDFIQRWSDPWGDSRDCFFLMAGFLSPFDTTDPLTLGDGEFLMVYGLNHVATGKAAYMSFNAYAGEEGQVPLGQVLDNQMPGTAQPYLSAGDPEANLMYAYKISRNCEGEANCLTLSIDNCPRVTVDANTKLGVVFRMYLESGSLVGPAMQEIVYDRVIKFSPKAHLF